ncbi:hypothetical protein EY643_11770 [Halioglobus maricola]|uniref:Uncharacterized protein n=1 Tax=Halioglobus maricola TaxID=2601894 RepID=A0A5P9NK91_9GAMM|nr:hypothetical protein [Halioglobus maricola]QFU76283.1 hypothetical protein EY643_11770 [Halioglobus maricola]
MKIKLSVIAVLTLSSQLVLADSSTEAVAAAEAKNTLAPVETEASAVQIKALEKDLTPNLDNMLEQQMAMDLEPQITVRIRQGYTSVN